MNSAAARWMFIRIDASNVLHVIDRNIESEALAETRKEIFLRNQGKPHHQTYFVYPDTPEIWAYLGGSYTFAPGTYVPS